MIAHTAIPSGICLESACRVAALLLSTVCETVFRLLCRFLLCESRLDDQGVGGNVGSSTHPLPGKHPCDQMNRLWARANLCNSPEVLWGRIGLVGNKTCRTTGRSARIVRYATGGV